MTICEFGSGGSSGTRPEEETEMQPYEVNYEPSSRLYILTQEYFRQADSPN